MSTNYTVCHIRKLVIENMDAHTQTQMPIDSVNLGVLICVRRYQIHVIILLHVTAIFGYYSCSYPAFNLNVAVPPGDCVVIISPLTTLITKRMMKLWYLKWNICHTSCYLFQAWCASRDYSNRWSCYYYAFGFMIGAAAPTVTIYLMIAAAAVALFIRCVILDTPLPPANAYLMISVVQHI